MKDGKTTLLSFMCRCANVLLAGVLTLAMLTGCNASQSETSQTDETTTEAETTSEEQAVDQAEEVSEEDTQDEASFASWADEATDKHGDATVYAVAELKGWQLETLLQQQDYAWSERNQMWTKIDGSAAVVVYNDKGETLSDDQIAELAEGAAESKVSYRIVTGGYSSAKRTLKGLATNVMTCEDSEIIDDAAVGVYVGPSGRRCLVIVGENNDVFVTTVVSEDAVSAGLLDSLTGQSVGTSIDQAFETLAGRPLESVTN